MEALETRSLLNAGRVSRSFLFTPIPEDRPLAEHIHAHLTITIDGIPQTVPAGIGLTPDGGLPLHTHNASGTIHVESTKRLPFRLRDFFAIWGQDFRRREILGHATDHAVTMTVNGRQSRSLGSLILRDGQEIVIRA